MHKRRLSLPTIYEGPLSTSPLHSIARPSPPSLVCPPLTGFLSHPCTCSISALLNHQDPRNELLFSADRSAHRTLFPAREKGPRRGAPFRTVSSGAYTLSAKGRGRKRKRKEKKNWRKLRPSCEKSLYLDGDPFENVSPVKKIGPWPAVGFRIIGKRGNLERWKVEMGGGG